MESPFHQIFKKQFPHKQEDLNKILEHFRVKKVSAKELLLQEGKICKELFFINSGMIRTFVNHDGNEITTWVALAGTIETSAQSFLKQTPSSLNLQAIQDCDLMVMNRESYYDLLNSNSSFNAFAFSMIENFYLRVEDKFYAYLFLSAEERLRKMKEQYPQHFEQVPLKYLASILRMKPETLSRLRKKYSTST